jgi:hypothetical protein
MCRIRLYLLFAVTVIASSAKGAEIPFKGIVADPIKLPFSLRLAPPTASWGSYSLGPFACAVFPGTTLYATDRREIANGEVWYFVQIEQPSGGTNLRKTECGAHTTGWLVGQLKDGRPVVDVRQENAPPPPGKGVVPPQQVTPLAFRHEEKHFFIGLYLMLVLGTVFGVAVVSWERHGSIAGAPLMTSLAIFEAIVLMIANCLLMGTMVPAYFAIDSGSVNAKFFRVLTQSYSGHVIIGFVLSIVMMQAISFARSPSTSEPRAQRGRRRAQRR